MAGSSECHRGSPFLDGAVWARIPSSALALLIVAALSSVQAQDLRVGIRAGPTFGFLNDSAVPFVSADGDATANTNVRLDVHAGAFVLLPLTDRVALQPELLFVQKGGHFSRPSIERYASERYRLSYLQGHILARRTLALSGPLSMHLVGGMTVARTVGGAVRRDLRSPRFTLKERIPLLGTDLIQRWDVGLLVGAGLHYPLGNAHRVSLNVRYNPGFRSVFSTTERQEKIEVFGLEDPPPLSRTPPALRHDVITASLAYTVPLGW